MASEKQIEANRLNAQHSTGPVTPDGKAASSRNAFKHGLRARNVMFGNDPRLEQFRDDFDAEYQPQTATEAALVEQMAVAFFKRTHFEELEACWEPQVQKWDFNPKLEIIWRRIAALDRAFNKALDQLHKIRNARTRPQIAKTDRKAAEVVVEAKSERTTVETQSSAPTTQPAANPRLVFVGQRRPEHHTPIS
jgi:phage tail sheath protein FI